METVRLRNGSTETKPLVAAIMLALESLRKTSPIAFYELAQACRDPKHEPWGTTGTQLRDWGLMEPDGRIHQSIRNIALSAVSGEGFDLVLGWPADLEEEGR